MPLLFFAGPLPDFPDNADMNGQVQYRGLPAPPMEAYIYEGDGMPPPCPREMYSQAGVYDEIPGEQVSFYCTKFYCCLHHMFIGLSYTSTSVISALISLLGYGLWT